MSHTKYCLERLFQEEVYRIVSSFSVAIGQIDRTKRYVDPEKAAAGDNQIVKTHIATVVPLTCPHERYHILR